MTKSAKIAVLAFAAAVAWPMLFGLATWALLSPADQLTRSAWCGGAAHGAAFVGHCATCWSGSALLAALGLLIMARGIRPLTALR